MAEGPALYGGKHYRDYHFLLTLSDPIGFEGIEHHESSDDRAPERYAIDDKIYRAAADLLPHEYSHSWNGKYRRPADLAVPDYQQPELTDLLWVYEGMTQYYGDVQAARAMDRSPATCSSSTSGPFCASAISLFSARCVSIGYSPSSRAGSTIPAVTSAATP